MTQFARRHSVDEAHHRCERRRAAALVCATGSQRAVDVSQTAQIM
jgi:hypothetical protein